MDTVGKFEHRPIWSWGAMDHTDLQTDSLREFISEITIFHMIEQFVDPRPDRARVHDCRGLGMDGE